MRLASLFFPASLPFAPPPPPPPRRDETLEGGLEETSRTADDDDDDDDERLWNAHPDALDFVCGDGDVE